MDDRVHSLIGFLLRRRTRYVIAWVVAGIWAGCILFSAWLAFDARGDEPRRADGNSGHTHIDFGGQWLMGAMLARGYGHDLYNRSRQWQVIQDAYPYEDEVPVADRRAGELNNHDAIQLMSWFMGEDDPHSAWTVAAVLPPLAVANPLEAASTLTAGQTEWPPERLDKAAASWLGGPLYPPINALYYYPLGLLRPQPAYRIFQVFGMFLAFLSALGIRHLSEGRIWWPVALVGLLIFPAFSNNLKLGQNAIVSLTFLIWGWVLIARGKEGWAGMVWGLLAFKPVWAAAFFLVPLLTRRWRVCLGMVATGLCLAAATLPFVGWQSWLNWLAIGRDAAELYCVNINWVYLSRDLFGVPRRFLLDFDLPSDQRDNPTATWLSWGLLSVVSLMTAAFAILRPKQARAMTGPAAAFLLLGAFFCCFHFMYYDVLLAALPVFLLFTEPRRYLEPIFMACPPIPAQCLDASVADYCEPGWAPVCPPPDCRTRWVVNRMLPTLAVALLIIEHLFPVIGVQVYVGGQPWDTYCLLLMWLWCGVLSVRMTEISPSITPNAAPGSLGNESTPAPLPHAAVAGPLASRQSRGAG
jgi:hypothetical protein